MSDRSTPVDERTVTVELTEPQVIALIRATDFALNEFNQGRPIWPRGPDDAHDRMEQATDAADAIEEQTAICPDTMAARDEGAD